MSKNLGNALVTRGTIPLLQAGQVLDVQSGLKLNGQAVIPHFVHIDGAAKVLATHLNGRFSLWNFSAADLINLRWRAEYSHSLEQSPLVDVPDDTIAGSVSPPPSFGTFLGLSDTPNNYVGSENYMVRVNPGGTDLVFTPLSDVIEGIHYAWADAAERAAQTGMVDGELGVQRDTGDVYRYNDPPGTWSVFFNLQDGSPLTGGVQGNILYHNGLGWTLLSAGVNGQVFTTQGPAANPIWAAAPGGGIFLAYEPNKALFPSVNPAAGSSRNERPILVFDTQDEAIFSDVMPSGYGGGDLSVGIYFAMATVAAGTIDWEAQFERIDENGQNLDANGFAAVQTTSQVVPAVNGRIVKATISFTQAEADSIAGGEAFRLKILRGTDAVVDTAQIIRVTVEG